MYYLLLQLRAHSSVSLGVVMFHWLLKPNKQSHKSTVGNSLLPTTEKVGFKIDLLKIHCLCRLGVQNP